MNHLAIDTATEVLSIALRTGSDQGRRFVRVRDAGLRHTASLMPMVDSLLAEAGISPRDLDLLSCARGPGSFTGLRIGMATAKGIASALDARTPPIVSVPTLDVMAAATAAPGAIVLPVIDGRKGRFYGAAYADGEKLTADLDLSPHELVVAATQARAPRYPGDVNDPDDTAAHRAVVVTGPHAAAFCEQLGAGHATELVNAGRPIGLGGFRLVVDPRARAGWASVLLEIAERRHAQRGVDSPDQGPEYVRGSDAEIARRNPPRYD